MGTFSQNFDGFSAGAAITTGSSGGQSTIANVQGTATATSTNAIAGTISAEITVSAGSQYIRMDNVGATGRCGTRFKFKYPGAPSTQGSLVVMRNNDATEVGICGVQVMSTGIFQMIRGNSGTAITESRPGSALLSAGDEAWVSMWYAPGATTSTARLGYRIYAADGTTVLHEWAPATDYDVGTTGSATRYRYMQVPAWATPAVVIDEIWGGDLASGWATPPLAPPTTVVTPGTASHWLVDARGSSAGGGTGATWSITHTSGPNHLGDVVEPVDGLFFIPQDTTAATYTITTTSSSGTDPEVVTVPALASTPATGGLVRKTLVGTSWI